MCVCLRMCIPACVCDQSPTMRCDGLYGLGGGAYVPCGQSSIRVAADELLPLMVPGHRVDSLQDIQSYIIQYNNYILLSYYLTI